MFPFIYRNKHDKRCIFGDYYIETEAQFDEWYAKMIKEGIYVFRGQKEARYKNYSSVQRFYLEKNFQGGGTENIVNEQLRILRTQFGDVLNRYCDSINTTCSDLFLLSLAQHCGGKTPLIDFTHDINIALYFMTDENYDNASVLHEESDLSEYSSVYYIGHPFVLKLDDMFETSSKVLKVAKDAPKEYLQSEFKKICQSLFSYRALNHLWSTKNILVENKRYEYKVGDHILSTSVSITNLNIVAQSGCFVYHDNTNLALETNISCVNIRKSLHNYIRYKYLQSYSKDFVFPYETNNYIAQTLKETCQNLNL